MTAYSDMFDDALRRWSAGDQRGALTGFTAVTHADPSVADAWLGRIAAGDLALATLQAAHQNSRFLFRETRRINWNDGQLAGQIECPKYFVMEINSRAGIALAYAAALITARRYGDAEAVLADSTLQSGPAGQWRHFLRTCMFYVTERWHDVVTTAANPPATPQGYEQALAGKVRAAVTTMAAVAQRGWAATTMRSICSRMDPHIEQITPTSRLTRPSRGHGANERWATRQARAAGLNRPWLADRWSATPARHWPTKRCCCPWLPRK